MGWAVSLVVALSIAGTPVQADSQAPRYVGENRSHAASFHPDSARRTSRATVTVSPRSVRAGRTLTISAKSCKRPAYATSRAFPGKVKLLPAGDVRIAEVKIPADTVPRPYLAAVRCGTAMIAVPFRVVRDPVMTVTPRWARWGQRVTVRTSVDCGQRARVRSLAFERPVRLRGGAYGPILRARAEISSGAPLGPYRVVAYCEDGRRMATVQVVGGKPGPDTGGGGLATAQRTSASSGGVPSWPMPIAVALTFAGGGALLLRRRRRAR